MEGHRLASAAQRTDFLRTLPPTPQTSMKNLAAGTLTADLPASSRRCVPPQRHSFIHFFLGGYTMMQPVLNVGVDVAKDAVVVACAEPRFPVQSVPNQRAPLRAWLKSLPAGSRIGLESTGDYHELLADRHTHKAIPSSCLTLWRLGTTPRPWATAPTPTGWMRNESPDSSRKSTRACVPTCPPRPTSASWIG